MDCCWKVVVEGAATGVGDQVAGSWSRVSGDGQAAGQGPPTAGHVLQLEQHLHGKPWLVIARPDGAPLARRTGDVDPGELNRLLREALKALQVMNIIENRQGSGNYVTSLEPRRLIEHLEVVFVLDDATYGELFAARKLLETGIAEQAASRITDAELAALEELVEEARREVDNVETFLRLDLELHNRIAVAAGNSILELFMSSVNHLSLYSRRRTADSSEVRRRTVQDHRAIVKALREEAPKRPGFPVVLLLAGNKEQEAHEIIREGLKDVPLRWELYGRDYIYDTHFIADRVEELVRQYQEEEGREE